MSAIELADGKIEHRSSFFCRGTNIAYNEGGDHKMANFGWFILIYVVIGWVLDVILTITLMIMAVRRDLKRAKKENRIGEGEAKVKLGDISTPCFDKVTASFGSTLDEADSLFKRPGVGIFLCWVIGRFIWPIVLPKGVMDLLDIINSTDDN